VPRLTNHPADPPPRSFVFGPFVFAPERQLLLQNEKKVRIGGRALDILTALVERSGEIVSKRELMARAWPNIAVEEGNLKVNMAALRRALGDGTGAGKYIATVTGRGYRFVAPVQPIVASGLAFGSSAAAARRHNLPTGRTRIFGRSDAIDAIHRDLHEARLVSIVGPGGVGKTTVALAVADHAFEEFRDGVWLVDLAPLRDPNMASIAIATAIGLAANSSDMLAALCEFLRDRQMLLVLDNCEHLIEAAAACINQILAEAAGVSILVTSREPLLVGGERVRRLPGLGTPPSSPHLDAEEALRFAAIQLFVDRATNRLESFELSDATASAVAEICRRLDGLALAIEFAATRIDAFGVSGLLKQLDERFPLFVGRRAGPERHRTLTATLDWSYGLLSESEEALLRAVSVFAGVFDIEGAAAVSNVAPTEVANALAELVAKSLLAVDLDGDDVAYRLLETTRAYCSDKRYASGEDGAIRQRHAEHLLAVLERATSEWAERPAGEWGSAYGRVIDDLRAALAWAGRDSTRRPLRIRLTLAGILLWNHFSLTEECAVQVSQAVEELDAAGLAGTAIEMKLKLWLGGATMFTRGLKPKAMDALRRALVIAVQIGDTDYHLRCLIMIGIYELFTGEHDAGMRTLETFAAVAAAEDPSILPEGEVHFGIAELFLGRLQCARERLERLQQRDLRYFGSYAVRYLSDPIVLVGSVLSQVQWLTGSPDTAARTAAVAVELAGQTSHHLSLNNILSYACPIFYWSGDYDECARYVGMLEEHVLRHGLVARRPVATFYRAALAYSRNGASPGGIEDLRHAIEEFRQTNHLARMPYYLSVVADALAHGGRVSEAEATIRRALHIAQTQGEGWCLPEVLRINASILAAQGQADEAQALLGKSMELAVEAGALSWRLRAANDLAALWRAGSREDDARDMLLPIFSEFTEGFSTRDLAVATDLLGLLSRPEIARPFARRP
jgi:predicted ATPase/DNA-binding winged helix-turn-helix (wHTH) protein